MPEPTLREAIEHTKRLAHTCDSCLTTARAAEAMEGLEQLLDAGWELQDWRPEYPEVYFQRARDPDKPDTTPIAPTLPAAITAALKALGESDA